MDTHVAQVFTRDPLTGSDARARLFSMLARHVPGALPGPRIDGEGGRSARVGPGTSPASVVGPDVAGVARVATVSCSFPTRRRRGLDRTESRMTMKLGRSISSHAQGIDPRELIAFCRGRLAGFEIPRTYHLVDALPVNPVGKILKRELTARIDGGEPGRVDKA